MSRFEQTFDKATSIEKGNHKTEFAYSPSRSRYKRTDTSGSDITTTFYLGGVEYIQRPNGQTFYRRSIPGAVIEVPVIGPMKVNYLHVDHLGSTDVITNSTGATAQEYSFDFFGQKRNVTNWSTILTNTKFSPLNLTSKSYTGHESTDEVGVIHMNGRIYDPKIGRFMQADPQIDGATDSKGYNRYTYVRNNPLAYTDPTGFRRSGGLKNFGRLMKAASYVAYGAVGGYLFNSNPKLQAIVNTVGLVVGSIYCPPCAPGIAAAQAAHTSAVNGGNAVDSAKAGGRAYVTTYISAQVSGAIGGSFDVNTTNGLIGSSISHGTLGGVMSVLNGGKFGHGFTSSFLSKYIGVKANLMDNIPGNSFNAVFTRTMIAGIIGGTVSAATGGKFANGAAQSAIQWAFNAEAGSRPGKEVEYSEENLKKLVDLAIDNVNEHGHFLDKNKFIGDFENGVAGTEIYLDEAFLWGKDMLVLRPTVLAHLNGQLTWGGSIDGGGGAVIQKSKILATIKTTKAPASSYLKGGINYYNRKYNSGGFGTVYYLTSDNKVLHNNTPKRFFEEYKP